MENFKTVYTWVAYNSDNSHLRAVHINRKVFFFLKCLCFEQNSHILDVFVQLATVRSSTAQNTD